MDFSKENLTKILNLTQVDVISFSKEIASFYAYLFNETDVCVSCPNKIAFYYRKLKENGLNLLNQMNMKEQEVNFKLRPEIGSLQMNFGSSECFNNNTLTDDIALRYLRINPNRIANFEVYPENWQELLEEIPTETEIEKKETIGRKKRG